MSKQFIYNVSLKKVVDGDTFDFVVDLGFKIHCDVRVRLKDYDTPELRGEDKELGKKYKTLAEEHLLNAKEITIETHKTGKYGRWLADIYIDGQSIVDIYKATDWVKDHE